MAEHMKAIIKKSSRALKKKESRRKNNSEGKKKRLYLREKIELQEQIILSECIREKITRENMRDPLDGKIKERSFMSEQVYL